MKTPQTRFVVEAAMAALLFFAANTVYAIDYLVGSRAIISSDETSMRIELRDSSDVRLPAPVQLRIDHLSENLSFFCLDLGLNSQAFDLDIPGNLQLVSDDGVLPYQLNLAGSCETRGEVGFDLVIDETVRSELASRVFGDTVIVSIKPE